MRTLGLIFMLAALAVLMAMVAGAWTPGLVLSLLSYCLLFVGVFLFAAGVIRRKR